MEKNSEINLIALSEFYVLNPDNLGFRLYSDFSEIKEIYLLLIPPIRSHFKVYRLLLKPSILEIFQKCHKET